MGTKREARGEKGIPYMVNMRYIDCEAAVRPQADNQRE
jgi:hypothetical protein